MNRFFMPGVLIVLAVIAVIAIVAAIFWLVHRRKAMWAALEEQFGKAPADPARIEEISGYWRLKQKHEDIPHPIDDITWNDLDMDSVYLRLDACHTTVGDEYLYVLLHMPVFDESVLTDRETLVQFLHSHPETRLQLQVYLSKMGKSAASGLDAFCYNISAKRLKRPALYTVLAVLPLVCAGAMFLSWPVGLSALILSLLANIIIYCLTKTYIERELAALRYFSSLLWCAKKISSMDLLPTITEELAAHLRIFKKIGGKISSVAKQRLSDADMFAEYIRIPFLIDIRNYNRAISLIEKHIAAFRSLYQCIGELDTAVAILSLRKSLPCFACPEFTQQPIVEAQDIRHPLLSDAVPNTAAIVRSSLVSGSNASGKSTFIKALAINGIFAQTIYTCTARRYRTCPALVITSMAVRDDIVAGESYFITELKSLQRIAAYTGGVFAACYIDEILKGTNTIERIGASAAVLAYLASQPCLCVAATHDIELTHMLEGRYDNYHFGEQMTDEGMYFDYTIKPGPSRTKNAIRLLDYMAFDSQIIQNAQRMVDRFEATGVWDALA